MRELVERALAEGRVTDRAPRRGERSVTINLRESPLAWLAARDLINRRQREAGERIARDYETAQLAPRTTMAWTPRVSGGSPGDATSAQLAAKRRFDAAIAEVGPGLADVLWRTACAGEGLPAAEKALGWPARCGRVVLGLALDRLADHYRLG